MLGLNSQGSLSFVLTLTFTTLSSAAVIFRLISNVYTNTKIHADSVWIVVALAGLYGYTASLVWGLIMSNGALDEREIQDNPESARWFIESTIPTFEFFIFTNAAVKISAILLYRRLFPTRRLLQLSQLTLLAIVAWWVVISIQWGLVCQPLTLFWSRELIESLEPDGWLDASAASHFHGFCNSPNALLFVGDMVSILIDHVVLFMPLPPLYGLKLPRKQKLGLMALFGVGTFSCISALVRLIFMFKPNQFYPGLADGQIWSSLHLSTAIIYACVPSFRPLGRKINEESRRYFSKPSSANGSSRPSRGVTPLMRNHSVVSRVTTPVSPTSPAIEVGITQGWPIISGAPSLFHFAGATSPTTTAYGGWVQASRNYNHDNGRPTIVETRELHMHAI